MAKIIMLKGLPGSGKTTWANQYVVDHPNSVRINKDELRRMLRGLKWEKSLEPGVIMTRDNIVSWALASGREVIVDDTNFAPKHEERLRFIAATMKADFEIKFIDTTLQECIQNDLKRLTSVGEKVIRRMYHQYLCPESPKVEFIIGLPTAIICDLDGTLCLHNGRSPYDTENCLMDKVNPAVKEILSKYPICSVIFVTGRDEKFLSLAHRWLENNFEFGYAGLFMRPTGDRRDDSIVKRELFDKYIRGKYNIEFVLDDRNRVVDMWRSLGLTCFQVAEGDF